MLNMSDIMETITMIQEENLDIRTITMGISLIDCADSDIDKSCEKVYNKIYSKAKNLVKTGEFIEKKYGIPIVNKRISVTPDVYKRQVVSKTGHSLGSRLCGDFRLLRFRGQHLNVLRKSKNIDPVSYTHLDVYKRQK